MSDLEYRQAARRGREQYHQLDEGPGWDAVKQKTGQAWDATKTKAQEIAANPTVQSAAKGVGNWMNQQMQSGGGNAQQLTTTLQNAGAQAEKIEQHLQIPSTANATLDQRLATILAKITT